MSNAILRNVLCALPLVLGTIPIAATPTTANADDAQSQYRFVVVPKVVHPWFDQLNEGAQEAAREIQRLTGAEVVATGVDNDSISTAQNQAAAIMQAHPDLDGWVPSNAAGPIGIGQAVKEAGKVGQVKIVGIDDLNQTLNLIQEGVIDSTSALRPRMMGYWFIISAWQRANGAEVPEYIDTGHVFIDQNNVEDYL